MSISEITAFRTSDGKIHETLQFAKAHESRYELREFMTSTGICQGGEWTAEMVFDWLIENRARLWQLLDNMKPRFPLDDAGNNPLYKSVVMV